MFEWKKSQKKEQAVQKMNRESMSQGKKNKGLSRPCRGNALESKQALGKETHASIPEEIGILTDEKYAEIDIELLKPNPLQPRLMFNERAINELARSIKGTGVLQPILCVPEEGYYKIIVGERRWRAAQKAGLRKIPVLIRNIPNEQQLEISLIENLQREELNPIEIAKAYERLIEELNYTQEEVGKKIGKNRTSVTNYLRLLNLTAIVQEKLKEGKISMGHARALLAVETPEIQAELCHKTIKRNLSVRDVEKLVSKRKPPATHPEESQPSPNLEVAQDEPARFLEAKQEISEKPALAEVNSPLVLILENEDVEKTVASLVKEMEDRLQMLDELRIQLEKLIDVKLDELMKVQAIYQRIKTLEQGISRVDAGGSRIAPDAARTEMAKLGDIVPHDGKKDRIKQEIENLQLIKQLLRSSNGLSDISAAAGGSLLSKTMAGLAVGKKKILIVEDDPVSRRLLSHFLEKENYAVLSAANAEDGIQILNQELPDLVLLDIMLPGADGFEFLSRIKRNEAPPSPSVFVISSLTKESDIVKALQAGATDYILKPFSPQVILAKINQQLRSG